MPTYDYECTKCGKTFELVQPITESARKKLRKNDEKPCKCNAPVSRLIGTGGGVIFKGSGFYETDYRSDSYSKAAKADKEAASGKTETKSDGTKSDTADKKTEAKPKETKKPDTPKAEKPAPKK